MTSSRDNQSGPAPHLLVRGLRLLLGGVAPAVEATLKHHYWIAVVQARHGWPDVIPGMKRGFRRGLVWVITSYHRYRGSVLVVDGVRLQMHRSLSRLMVERIWSGHHTREERELVLDALAPDDVVLELGGGLGLLAISCAMKIGGARVHSVEANPRLEPLVRRNCHLNRVYPSFEFCILGNHEGSATLHVGRHFYESSLIQSSDHDTTVSVAVKPFDEVVSRLRPTFLIVDIEGAEEDLFRHADLKPMRKIMIELHPLELGAERAAAVRDRIVSSGFEEQRRIGDQWFLYRRKNRT